MDAEGVGGHRMLSDQKGGIACEAGQSSAGGEAERNRGIFIRPESTGREEEGSGWGTCVHPWRIHVDVWQNQCNIVN